MTSTPPAAPKVEQGTPLTDAFYKRNWELPQGGGHHGETGDLLLDVLESHAGLELALRAAEQRVRVVPFDEWWRLNAARWYYAGNYPRKGWMVDVARAAYMAGTEQRAATNVAQIAEKVITADAPQGPSPYEQMVTGNHAIGIFKDGKLVAADSDVYAAPQAEREPEYFDNDGYVCQMGVKPHFVLKSDYDALSAKLAECERERERLEKRILFFGIDYYDKERQELIERASQAESRAAAAERDVERLDWAENNPVKFMNELKTRIAVCGPGCWETKLYVRNAIDAALTGEKRK